MLAASQVWAQWWVGDTLGVLLFAPVTMAFLQRRQPAWALRWQPVAMMTALVGVVVGWTVVSWQVDQKAAARESVNDLKDRLAYGIQAEVAVYRQALREVQHHLQIKPDGDARSFGQMASYLTHDLAGLLGVSFNPMVRPSDRAAFEARLSAEMGFPVRMRALLPDGRVGPAPAQSTVAFPVGKIAPLPPNVGALGFDIASEPRRRAALDRAIESGQPAVTEPIALVQEKTRNWSMLMIAPVYPGAAPNAQARGLERLSGLAVAVVKLGPMLEHVVGKLLPPGYGFRLEAGQSRDLVFESQPKLAFDDYLTQTTELTVVGQGWRMQVGPLAGAAGAPLIKHQFLGLLLMLLATWTLQFVVLLLAGRHQAVRHEVSQQTQHLLARQQELERTQELARLGSWVQHADGSMDLSAQAAAILGHEAGASFGLPELVQAVHAEDAPAVQALLQTLSAQGGTLDTVCRLVRSGEPAWVRLQGQYSVDAQGSLVQAEGTVQDISELKAAELQAQAVMDAANDAIIMLNPQGRVSYWNAAAERVFGFQAMQVMGHRLEDCIVPAAQRELHSQGHQRFQNSGHGQRVGTTAEMQALHADGHTFTVELTLSAVRHRDGWHALGVCRDVTARKEQERLLRQAKDDAEAADQAKSEFLATVSHELRTPMNAVLGLLPMLADTDLDPVQRGYVSSILGASKGLMRTLNDILDFSSLRAGAVELESRPFVLFEMLHNLRTLYRSNLEEKGVALRIEPADDLSLSYLGDAQRLSQVLNNLVGNALKFTAGGAITVRARNLGARHALAPGLRFEVIDTGIGLTPEQQSRMFKSFSQADNSTRRQYGGSGLGLSICKQLVELMGGAIGVVSAYGKGSTFWFELPLVAAEPSLEDSRGMDRAGSMLDSGHLRWSALQERLPELAGVRVLVVEDNATNQMVARVLLESFGVAVETADNGELGVQRLASTGQAPIDLVLMDLHMPVMDGLAATRAIRASDWGKSIPVVAMTAAARESDREAARQAGMNDFVAKPVEREELAQALLSQLAGQPAKPKAAGAQAATGLQGKHLASVQPAPASVAEAASQPAVPQPKADSELVLEGFDLSPLMAILGNKPEAVRDILRHYLDDLVRLQREWQNAMAQQDWGLLNHAAHSLAGMAPSMGAVQTGRAARAFYDDLRAKGQPNAALEQAAMACIAQDLRVLAAAGVSSTGKSA
jgi:PAS domain S-box-containing protein